jgi:hypothetical protein
MFGRQKQNPHRGESDQQAVCTPVAPVVQIGAVSAVGRHVFPIVAMAPTNKCLAQSNKTRTDGNATMKRKVYG